MANKEKFAAKVVNLPKAKHLFHSFIIYNMPSAGTTAAARAGPAAC